MKEIHDYQQDIASIRSVMERSAKFISLSGLSGVLAGVYALVGSSFVYYMLYYPGSPFGFQFQYANEPSAVTMVAVIASIVLIFSIGTGYLLSLRKAKRLGVSVWGKTSQQLLINLLVPLISGGLFILILIAKGNFALVAPVCLIFYGLALIQAGPNTFLEIRYLGFCEIVLGLITAFFPGLGLVFWAIGFGLLHIVYGSVMHYRYDS